MPSAQLRDMIMYYEEAGSGDPLILMMGLGADLQAWALQVPELSKHFRVITVDNRGAGRSSAPDRIYSIAGMAEDVRELMDQLEIEKAHVLGFSMGGMIAQELALAHPNRVDKLILLGTAARVDGYTQAVVRSWTDITRSSMSREQVVRARAPFLYSAALFDDNARYEQAIQNSLANPYAQQDHAFLRQAQALLQFDATERVKNVKQQALVVVGEEDILVPPRNSQQLVELLPNATLVQLPGGHVGMVEHAAEYNAAFLDFLGVAEGKTEATAASA